MPIKYQWWVVGRAVRACFAQGTEGEGGEDCILSLNLCRVMVASNRTM